MSRQARERNRTKRSNRQPKRVHDMEYYYVVTDTEATERCYFNGL